MSVAVISDIHGNSKALDIVLNDIRNKGIKKVIVLGDIVIKGPNPQESFDLLKNSELEILAWIKGNTDEWFVNNKDDEFTEYARENFNEESIEFLLSLPSEMLLEIEGKKVLCVHGTPRSNVSAIDRTVPEEMIRKELNGVNVDLVLCGHSHTSFIGQCDGIKIFNVGSVGNSLDEDKEISYGRVTINNEIFELTKMKIKN